MFSTYKICNNELTSSDLSRTDGISQNAGKNLEIKVEYFLCTTQCVPVCTQKTYYIFYNFNCAPNFMPIQNLNQALQKVSIFFYFSSFMISPHPKNKNKINNKKFYNISFSCICYRKVM